MYRLLNFVVCLHLTISGIEGYDRRGVTVITVIIGDNPIYGYYAQSPAYDMALARALRTFPHTLSQVRRLSVYKPGCSLEVIALGDFAREWDVPLIAVGFINALKKSSHIDALNVLHFDARTADNEGYENMLQTAGTQSRVILLFVATARRLRDIMVTADRLNMTSGDYIFIAPRSPAVPMEGALQWQFNVTSDDQAFTAFQSLITVSNPIPRWNVITALMNGIRNQSQLVYNRTLTLENSINDLTVSAAEVMSSITEVLSQFSSRQLEVMTGTDFRKHFLNRTFELDSRSVFIGPKGMRICDVDLYRMNATTGEIEIVWQYKSVSDTFRQTSLQNVIWRSQNGPPVNRPVCGFRGDRCIGSLEKSVVATIVVLTVLVSFIFGAGIFWFSHQHMNESVWWLLEEMRLVSAITRSKLGSFQSVQRP
ncbi:hypothetical protein BV898_19232 [Hypsibius exemplaris]|uniref:Receptor ligand binding region domain-containing protein n=1 Tax=Hypsibius exemplaris TaxID=2072580 RepID=A0A9X6NKH0_HYPEX|nr:hypothetical protein BV898_19232 [Hypsibius exemplaris]